MADISIQNLQDIAVKATTDFFNGTSLNESLAKQASELDLNSDQLKRAIEATNTLAFLKSAEVHADKTVEFPVADYNEILKLACVPEDLMAKTASEKVVSAEVRSESDIVKAAELAMVPEPIKMDQDRLRKELYKSAQMNKRVIQNLEDDLVRSADKFLKMAKDLTSRSTGFEELSASSVDDNTFAKIASLLYPGSGPRKDWAGFIHKSASINVAEDLAITYVRLSSIDKELGLRKQAQLKVEELEKAGFFTLGRVVGKTVAWPVKTLGKAVANTAQGVGKVIKTKTQNTVADTGLGKSLKVPKVEMPNNIKRNLSVLGATTGAAFDAASYTPKTDPASGRMGDVWDAIRK